MTISNHAQSQSNGAKKNGEKAKDREGAKNGEAAKAKQPETHPKNGAPKASTKENGTKKQGKTKPTPTQEKPRPLRDLGFRGHCEDESHFPTASLLLPDLDAMKRWVGTMANSLVHIDCAWKAEQVFVGEDGHLYSRVGEMNSEHPSTGLVDWTEDPPFDLGPLPSGALPELGQEIKTALASASGASKGGKEPPGSPEAETKPAAKTNGEPGKKPIGESTPAPKPGERTARAKSLRPKSAPPKRLPTRAFRVKAASKNAKRA